MPGSEAELVAGVDLGGTHVRTGVIESGGDRLCSPAKFKVAGLNLPAFCDRLEESLSAHRGRIAFVGIGVTGPCDRDLRKVITTFNFVPFLEGCALADAVEARLGVPVRVDNDVRVNVRGEFDQGGWGRPRSLVVLTLGTGVGLGWVLDGNVYPPPDHSTLGGHMVLNMGGSPCYCGLRGCLESMASATALAAGVNEALARYVPSRLKPPATCEAICAAAAEDPLSRTCVQHAVEALRAALHNVHHLYFPDVVILNGGAATGLWPFLQDVREWFSGLPRFDGRHNRLELSKLGDDAAIWGAAAMWREVTGR